MDTKDEVLRFLKCFKDKARIFGILFRDDRGKNTQTLLDLEITSMKRIEIIMNLEETDFIDGPLKDTLYKISDMWIFGKTVKKKEVYIKISMGTNDNCAICISFHIAEHKLAYKFK